MANKINWRRGNRRGDRYVRCMDSHPYTPAQNAALKKDASRTFRSRARMALRREVMQEHEGVVYPHTPKSIAWDYW